MNCLSFRNLSTALLACLVTFGCAAHRPPVVLAPVGPAHIVVSLPSTNGTLVVFDAFDSVETSDPEHVTRLNYDILATDHHKLKHVINHFSPMVDDPVSVSLSPGTYVVRAPAQGYGWVEVPVQIVANRTTIVRLDGSDPGAEPSTNRGDWVYLPNGKVVGWRAEP